MSDVQGSEKTQWDDLKVSGDWLWRRDEATGEIDHIVCVCPCGCGQTWGVPVRRGANEAGKHWGWDGDEQKPTLMPSIRLMSGCKWHGHLVKGVWKGQCE